jgi:hypothetical protein
MRPWAILPILKGSECTVMDEDWLQHRRLELYHRSMYHIIRDINDLCSRDIYIRFAYDKVRCSRAFYHVLVMDGAEVAAALLCDVNQCPVCTCPHSELDRTDVSCPYDGPNHNTESVKREVDAARSEHLDDDGATVRSRNGTRTRKTKIIPDIISDIVTDVPISYLILYLIDLLIQVERLIRLLKHKLRLENAHFQGAQF